MDWWKWKVELWTIIDLRWWGYRQMTSFNWTSCGCGPQAEKKGRELPLLSLVVKLNPDSRRAR